VFRQVFRVYHAAFSGLPRDVWLLAFVSLVNRSGTMVLPFISLYITQDRGLSVTAAGRILGVYGIGSTIGSYLGGWLSDRIGAQRSQLLSLVATGVGFLWLSVLEQPAAITIAILMVSTVAEAFRPANMAAMAQRAPETVQVRSFALLRLAANLGMGVGPAVGGVLALYSYTWLFVADAATCWAAALLLVLLLPEPASAEEDEQTAAAGRRSSPWTDFPFVLLTLLVALLAMAFFQIFSTLPLYFRQVLGYRENVIGMLLGFNALLIVLFEMVLIHWAERKRRMLLIGVGAFLVCAGLGLTPYSVSLPLAALVIAVWTLGEMLSLPLINAVVADRAAPGSRGRYMGFYTMSFSVAFIFAPMAGTWIYENLGPRVLWTVVGALGPLLFVWAQVLASSFRRR
jgi:predicted MFS family arabinose efflux permease